jgi:gliding motility-associated-like protein
VVMNPPQANFNADRQVAEVPDAVFNFMVLSHSPKIADWHWDFGDGHTGSGIAPVHQYQNEGFYTVTLTITDSTGCRNVIQKQSLVEVKRNVNVIVPNAFSPNGDGINDFFNIQYRLLQTFHIKIFDRWGNQVYESSDMHFRWDGTQSGNPSPEGVYMYLISGTTTDGTPVETGGSFTLIR